MHFAGIDWGNSENVVCVVNASGSIVNERTFEHSPDGVQAMVDWLCGFAAINIAIERPHGPIVEALLERDATVYAINPKQLDRFRDRFTVAGAKDDRRDAAVLASSLRTDEKAFRQLSKDAPWVIELREWARIHAELGIDEVRCANRLREQLARYYPQILQCGEVTEEWVLKLIEIAPTPARAKKLPATRIAKLLAAHRIRRMTAEEVASTLRGSSFSITEGTVEAASAHVKVLITQLKLVLGQRKQAKAKLEELLDEGERSKEEGRAAFYQDIRRFQTLPGCGVVVVSTVITEAARPISERDYATLRCLAGVAPITKRSGKSLLVVRRHACNPRLRNAMHHWARVAAQCDDEFKAKYARLRAKGHSHGRALRTIGDKLLKTLTVMLVDGTDYDASRVAGANAA